MDKKTIIYSFKTIFKKTKLICPYCGTVQNYKKNSCCVCHKSLDSVKDNTLKIKNCIRAGIGILVLSVISVVTAMVINNALKKKPVNDNKYVQKETETTSKTEETSLTKETTENTTSVKETISETPTTQAPTTEPPTTVPQTKKPTVPESKPFSIDDVKWIKEPYLSCDTVIPLSEVVGENSDMRFSDGGDWWSRAYYGFIEGNNTDLKKYQPHKYGLVDFNGNVVIDYSYEIEVSEPHGHAYIGHGDDSGSVIDKVMGIEWEEPAFKIEEPLRTDECQAILMCSDGFWELITEKEMCKILKKSNTVQEWIEKMAEVVHENGKDKNMDNNSAIGIWIG